MPSVEVTIQNLRKRGADGKSLEFSQEEFAKLVDQITRDGGTGTWLPLSGLEKRLGLRSEDIDLRYGVKASQASAEQGSVRLTFPYANFDFRVGGIPHLLGTVAGDILGYPEIADAKIVEVRLPPEALSSFHGPQCGIQGVRKLLGIKDRPLIAFTAKPRLGLDPQQFALWCADAAEGGVDIVEDDERLLNPQYCGIQDRARAVLAEFSKRKVKDKIYSVNITGNEQDACQNAIKLADVGIRVLKFDVLAGGFGALQHLTAELKNRQVPVTVYPGMGFVFRALTEMYSFI